MTLLGKSTLLLLALVVLGCQSVQEMTPQEQLDWAQSGYEAARITLNALRATGSIDDATWAKLVTARNAATLALDCVKRKVEAGGAIDRATLLDAFVAALAALNDEIEKVPPPPPTEEEPGG